MNRASALSASSPRSSRPAPGPLLDRRVEEDLQVGVRQDDRPDVAPGHDDPARLGGQGPLEREQRGAQLRDARHGRHRLVDARRVDVGGHVRAVDGHVGQPAVRVRHERDLRNERDERGRIAGGGDAALEREPRRRPIEQPRVAESVAQLERRRGADARLPRRARPVDGDDETWVLGVRHSSRIPADGGVSSGVEARVSARAAGFRSSMSAERRPIRTPISGKISSGNALCVGRADHEPDRETAEQPREDRADDPDGAGRLPRTSIPAVE